MNFLQRLAMLFFGEGVGDGWTKAKASKIKLKWITVTKINSPVHGTRQ